MNATTHTALLKLWEPTLRVGNEITAIWNKVVFGKTYTYRASATITAVNRLDFQVDLHDNGGDKKRGKGISLPRFLNRERTDLFRAAPASA